MPDNGALKSLFNEFNPKLNLAKDYNEFATIMSDEKNRKDFFNEFNGKLNLAKDYDQFNEVLGLKKKEPTTSGLQSGSPISTKPFDVFQTERNKKSTLNVATGEVKPYVEPKKLLRKSEDKSSFLTEIGNAVTSGFGALGSLASSIPSGTLDTYGRMNPTNQGILGGLGILTDWIKDIKTSPNDNLALQYISKFSNIGKEIKQQPKNNIDAEKLGELTEKYIGIPEEYNPLSPNNSVTQYFNKVQKENSDKAYKNYDGGILKAIKDGNYKTAGKLATLGAAQSLPIMLGIVASRGAGVGNYQTLAGLGIGTASQEYEKLKEENPNIDKNLLLINAQLTGLGEAGSELVGTSLLYDQAKNLFKKGLKNEAEKVIKSGVKSYIDNMFKKSFIGSATLSDMKGEMTNKVWKNAIDKWSGVDPNRDYTDGVVDAGVVSLFSSGGTSIGLKAISNVVNPSSKNILKEKIKALDEINLDIDKKNIADGVKTLLQEKGNQLTEEINDIINSENNKLKSLPNNKQEKAIELGSELDAIEKSLQNEDLSDITKQELEAKKVSIEEDLDTIFKEQKLTEETPTVEIPNEISNLGDEEVVTLNVKTLDEVPEQFRERATLSELSEIETRKKILGLPIGKKETKLIGGGYTYTLTGKEAKDYAIQKQAAGQVPVQSETTVSEEVEQGKPEAKPESVTEEVKEEDLDKNFVVNEIKNGAIDWDGNMSMPRPVLGLDWKEIRKGKQDLLNGKDTAASRKLTQAILEARKQGGYNFVAGGGKLTTDFFVPIFGSFAVDLTPSELEFIAKNEQKLANEYDNWFNNLSEKQKQNELNLIEDGSTKNKINAERESKKNVPNQETTKSKGQEEVKSVEELIQQVKKSKGKEAKTFALQELKNNSTKEEFKLFMDENPNYEKYISKEKIETIEPTSEEITNESEVVLPNDKSKFETNREKLDRQEQEVMLRIKKKLGNLSSGFNPDVISDLIELGSIYIQRGVVNFKEFATKLKDSYGEDIPEDILRDIYKKSANKLGFNIRRTPERIATSEGISENLREVADEVNSVYEKQDYKELQKKLDDMSEVEKNALVGTLANVTGQLNAEGNVGVLAAIDLINKYEAQGNIAEAKRVFDMVSQSATAVAQLLRQYGELKGSTLEGFVSLVEKRMLKEYNIKLDDVQRQKIKDLYELQNKANEDVKKSLDEVYENLTKDNYKKYTLNKIALENARRNLENYLSKIPPATAKSFFETATSIVQGNLLTLKSLIVNPFANAIQTGIRYSSNEIANILDFIQSNVLGTERTRISLFDRDVFKLGTRASLEGLSKANRSLLKGSTSEDLNKIDVNGRLKPVDAWKSLWQTIKRDKKNNSWGIAKDVLEAMPQSFTANLSLRLLPYGDLPFNEQAKIFKLIEIGKRKFKLKGQELEKFTIKPDEASLKEAQDYADIATLQNSNIFYKSVTDLINKLDAGKTGTSKVLGAAGKFIVRGLFVPFLKTPINYAVSAFRFANPIIPLAEAVYYIGKSSKDAIKIKNTELRRKALQRSQNEITKNIGEAIVSYAVITAAKTLLLNALITGSKPDDKEEKNFMYNTVGPNMINISGLKRLLSGGSPKFQQGDVAVSYHAMGLLGSQLGIMSDTQGKDIEEKKRKDKYITTEGKPFFDSTGDSNLTSIKPLLENIPASLNNVLNQGFAQGAGTLLEAVSKNEYNKWSTQTVKTLYTGLAVPNTAYQAFKASEDYYRNVYTDDFLETLGNVIKERHGDTKGLPINYDMWGKPIKSTPEGSNPYIYNMIDIFRTQDVLKDKYTFYIYDLYKKTGDKKAIPPSIKDTFGKEDGLIKKLTPQQESELQRIIGEERRKRIDKPINEGGLNGYDPNNSDEEYIKKMLKRVDRIYDRGLTFGKMRFKKEVLNKNK